MHYVVSIMPNQPQGRTHHRFNDILPIRAHPTLIHLVQDIPRPQERHWRELQPPKDQLSKSSCDFTVTKQTTNRFRRYPANRTPQRRNLHTLIRKSNTSRNHVKKQSTYEDVNLPRNQRTPSSLKNSRRKHNL